MKAVGKLLSILRVAPYRTALFRHRVAAGIEHERVLGPLQLRTVVDVGANRGQFGLFARRCHPSARLIAFEPLPVPASRFRRVLGGDAYVTLHMAALGFDRGSAAMHATRSDDCSSLFPPTAQQQRLSAGAIEVGTQNVHIGRLTDFVKRETIRPPALLKLDVQGYELEVLRGAEELLQAFDWIYAECSFVELYRGQPLADEVITWLRERGFRVQTLDNLARDHDGRVVQVDVLFGRC
jgi:FkbM family methyltransferase